MGQYLNQNQNSWGQVNLAGNPNSNAGYQGIDFLGNINPNLDYSVAPSAPSGFGTINQQPLTLGQNSMGIPPAATSGNFLGMGSQGWGNTIGGIQALGNMYFANKGLKETRKQNTFNRNLASTNLANQAQSFRHSLDKKSTSDYFASEVLKDKYQSADAYVSSVRSKYDVKDKV